MLTELREELAAEIMPEVFGEIGDELVTVLRAPKAVADGYGGASAPFADITYKPIPAKRKSYQREIRTSQGAVWSTDKFTIPMVWAEELEIRVTDRLLRLEGGTGVPEQEFHIIEVRRGVLYEIICTTEQL